MVHISHSGPRSFKSCIYSSYQTQTTSYNTMLHVWRLQSWTKNIVSLQLLENSTFQNTHENLFLFIYYYYFSTNLLNFFHSFYLESPFREFPSGLAVKIWCFHCHGPGLDPWAGILQGLCCGQKKTVLSPSKGIYLYLLWVNL